MTMSTAATEDVRTRRLRAAFFREAWRMESVPAMAGSIRVLVRVEPAKGAFGSGCEVTGVLSEPRVSREDACWMFNPYHRPEQCKPVRPKVIVNRGRVASPPLQQPTRDKQRKHKCGVTWNSHSHNE